MMGDVEAPEGVHRVETVNVYNCDEGTYVTREDTLSREHELVNSEWVLGPEYVTNSTVLSSRAATAEECPIAGPTPVDALGVSGGGLAVVAVLLAAVGWFVWANERKKRGL